MQDSLVVTGKFLGAKPTEEVGTNGFLKRLFYIDITTNAEYPNTPEMVLTGDKVSLVDNLTKGQTIQVKFNIDGRKFTSKTTNKEGIITQLRAWKIDVVQMQSAAVATSAPARAAAPVAAMAGPGQFATAATEEESDLPF